MSKTGKTVFASSFAAFLTGRVYDQIRCSIAYSESNVKLVSTHAGLTLRRRSEQHTKCLKIYLL
jgi:transketolase, pyridine binding domain protein